MTHEEYWDYLDDIVSKLVMAGMQTDSAVFRLYFKLTASPYHYWLENKALTPSTTNAKGSSEDLSTSPPDDPSNLADKAQEIREKARTAIRMYKKTDEAQWPDKALTDLWALKNDWAPAIDTLYRALDSIPDIELVKWNEKHEVFE